MARDQVPAQSAPRGKRPPWMISSRVAGASRATVSRVINDHPSVSAVTLAIRALDDSPIPRHSLLLGALFPVALRPQVAFQGMSSPESDRSGASGHTASPGNH
ncbi:LacI family DNA-binding transcriptional regulator [Microbacterium sp. EYE_512]|uniref:LacI family transcriptional regulator n=1 Tax=Microbacterium wangchenii TaxID=2541726 RepID=A0ABX5SQQ7_9MICO|nr:LacI family DNA-binding transcriptional regulator [Microbacterium sp. EYE_512]QBR87493.1 LacI family transcriptional regulator [Microbacterium wangchenii]TXK14822.1 LacI family transcriptional regulator [Microbacterium wangchenii]